MLFLTLIALCLSPAECEKIAEKIWHNECRGKVEELTTWHEREEFPSLGIGHFIWYPEGVHLGFEEQFPLFLLFAKQQGLTLPAWLEEGKCPWATREAFMEELQSDRMKELRQFLLETKAVQAAFIAERVEKVLPKLCEQSEQKEKVVSHFHALTTTSQGLYAVTDYLNFKGEGILPTERYNGQGWGLLQVLEGMENGSLEEFVKVARDVLERRVKNSPPERQEERRLQGWFVRLESYR